MILPNFLIIGAARCGTTSLYDSLNEHPNIYLPEHKRPEPHFFLKSYEYNKGLKYYSSKYFSKWRNEKAIGEASTSYIYQSYVPERIHNHIPDVKMIALLRNPVDRAYSNYWVSVHNGLEDLSFENALESEKTRIHSEKSTFWKAIQPYAYMNRGFYYQQLSRYFRYFKKEQLLIIIFEDFIYEPAPVLKMVFQFLEVDDNFLPGNMREVKNKLPVNVPPMSPATRKYLINVFKSENERLSECINQDLSHWNR